MNRFHHFQYNLLGTYVFLLTAGLVCTDLDQSKAKKPNVIFIISDDLNDAVQGMNRHPQSITPNINQFMETGVTFTNAHSNNPICAPSRASFLTGLYPHTSGYYGYDQGKNKWYNNPVLKKAASIFEYFNHHGYNVYGTGKLFHHKHAEVLKREDGFNGNSLVPRDVGPYAYNGKEKVGHPLAPDVFKMGKWPEFVSFASLADVPQIPPKPQENIPGYEGWVNGDRTPFHYKNDENRDVMADERHAQWAADVLQQQHDKPFFITVGFHKPHSPWYAPDKYFKMHPPDQIQLPPYLKDDLEDCAKILEKDTFKPFQIATNRFKRMKEAYGEEKLERVWKQWIQAYLACVSFVDAQIGTVLKALENSNYAENTIVIVTSDHGYHMGEKDRLWKHTMWEESTRIPLIIRTPEMSKKGVECKHPVSLIDIYPTLVDLCGLTEKPHKDNEFSLDGYSLRSLLEHPQKDKWSGPEVALSCINGLVDPGLNQPGKINNQHFSVRSERYRYTLCSNGEEELYDHKKDPHEWQNLADDKKYKKIKTRLRKQMKEILGKLPE